MTPLTAEEEPRTQEVNMKRFTAVWKNFDSVSINPVLEPPMCDMGLTSSLCVHNTLRDGMLF